MRAKRATFTKRPNKKGKISYSSNNITITGSKFPPFCWVKILPFLMGQNSKFPTFCRDKIRNSPLFIGSKFKIKVIIFLLQLSIAVGSSVNIKPICTRMQNFASRICKFEFWRENSNSLLCHFFFRCNKKSEGLSTGWIIRIVVIVVICLIGKIFDLF